jgi:hypothetical protein
MCCLGRYRHVITRTTAGETTIPGRYPALGPPRTIAANDVATATAAVISVGAVQKAKELVGHVGELSTLTPRPKLTHGYSRRATYALLRPCSGVAW